MRYLELKRKAKIRLDEKKYGEAMKIYREAAKAAADEGADPVEVAKCYTNESQMALNELRKVFYFNKNIEQSLVICLSMRCHSAAKLAVQSSEEWTKGFIYLARAEAILNLQFCCPTGEHKALDEYINRVYPNVNNSKIDEIKDPAFWLVLKLANHSHYKDFIKRQPGFDAIKFPSNVFYVNPSGAGCCTTITDALFYAMLWNQPFSLLIEPGVYEDDFGLPNHIEGCYVSLKYVNSDFVGNRLPYEIPDFKEMEKNFSKSLSLVKTDVILLFRRSLSITAYFLRFSRVALVRLNSILINLIENSRIFFYNSFVFLSYLGNEKMESFISGEKTRVVIEKSFFNSKVLVFSLMTSQLVCKEVTINSDPFAMCIEKESVAHLENVKITSNGIFVSNSTLKAINSNFSNYQESSSFDMKIPTNLFLISKSKVEILNSKIRLLEGKDFSFCVESREKENGYSELILKNNKIYNLNGVILLHRDSFDCTLENNEISFLNPQYTNCEMTNTGTISLLSLFTNEKIVLNLHNNKVTDESGKKISSPPYYDVISRNPRELINITGEEPSFYQQKLCSMMDEEESIHFDVQFLRLTKEGRKQSQAGHKLCGFCLNKDTEKDKFMYCGRCKIVSYCSEECQKKHWKTVHKKECAKRKNIRR